ncbi:MAG: hypothetical protein ACKVS9_02035 [Phycisphaerae bacterium]
MLEFSAVGGVVGAVLLACAVVFARQGRVTVARAMVLGLAIAGVVGLAIGGGLMALGLLEKRTSLAIYLWASAIGLALGAWRGHVAERRLGLCPSQRRGECPSPGAPASANSNANKG